MAGTRRYDYDAIQKAYDALPDPLEPKEMLDRFGIRLYQLSHFISIGRIKRRADHPKGRAVGRRPAGTTRGEFSTDITRLLGAYKITRTEVQRLSGIAYAMVCDIITGLSRPSAPTAVRLIDPLPFTQEEKDRLYYLAAQQVGWPLPALPPPPFTGDFVI